MLTMTKEAQVSRGSRSSQWLVVRRCLAIIRRVQRGPTDWQGLVQAVLDQEGMEAYGQTEGSALRKRLRHDLEHIRRSLDIQLYADRRSGEYVIRDTELPLLDLPDEELATIAWLEQTFTANAPSYREVRAFLERLRFYLAPDRRLKIEEHRTALVVDLGQRDEDKITAEVEVGLAQALARRRRVEFEYLSPQYEDGQTRRHIVDIYEPYYFDTVRRHYYVRGWCHYIVGPMGQSQVDNYITYRLGRMRQVQLLPHKLPPAPPPGKRYPVVYWLAPDVARSGVTYRQWIHIERIEKQPDESAIVHGATESIFWAVQELMHYRHNCRVLGGPEMLQTMTETVKKMAELYVEEV
jgi:predicted DNA-binding transcriptional regulator YafY